MSTSHDVQSRPVQFRMKRVLCVGHAVQDFVFRVPRIPDQAEKYRASEFSAVGGGPASTAAVAIVRLGGAARLAARVGDDLVGRIIRDELEDYGVDCRHLHHFVGHQSSVSAVFVDATGERLIVNHADATLPMDPAWLETAVYWDDVDSVLADTRWPEGAEWALSEARRRGKVAVLDADVPVPMDGRLLDAATHVAFSLPGLQSLTGCSDESAEIGAALVGVARRAARWCCVTRGAHGVLVAEGRPGFGAGTLHEIPAFAVTPVDTLGAGDVWHGAFALALAEGADEAAAIRSACAAAAVKVTRSGGRKGAPTREERDRLLAGNSLEKA